MNRNQLKSLKAETFLTGRGSTTALNVRNYEDELIDSTFNVDDDSNNIGGVPIIDNDGHIPHTVIKSNQNNGFPKITSGRIDNTYVKESSPTGYKVLDNNGAFVHKTKVFTSNGTEVLLPEYDAFIATIASDKTWTTPEVIGNKRYEVINISAFNLTLNYPGGLNMIYNSILGSVVNSCIVGGNGKITIIDNGQYLIITR